MFAVSKFMYPRDKKGGARKFFQQACVTRQSNPTNLFNFVVCVLKILMVSVLDAPRLSVTVNSITSSTLPSAFVEKVG